MNKELVYIEHRAGVFEEGIQICVLCGEVICDYSGNNWASLDGTKPPGWPEGPLYMQGKNPTMITSTRPEINYGEDDPYTRIVKPCVNE